MERFFIQYYSENNWYYRKNMPLPKWHFRNGFSSSYKKIKNYGDFIWLQSGSEIPITSGEVYVSLSYEIDGLNQIKKCAAENPNIKFILGGPLFSFERNFKIESNNIKVYKKRVEDYFNIPYNPDNWGLELPKGFDNIGYDVSVINGVGCSWGKCTYCKWSEFHKNKDYGVLKINRFPIVEYPGIKNIWIHSASLQLNKLKECFFKIPNRDDVNYCFYIRADETTYKELKAILPKIKCNPDKLFVAIGVELPDNHILNYIKKGTTKEIMLKTIKLLVDYGCQIHLTLIDKWNNLTEEIVNNVIDWFNKFQEIYDEDKTSAILYKLEIVEGREIFKNPPGPIAFSREVNGLKIYNCVLDEQQVFLNDILRKKYKEIFKENLLESSDKNHSFCNRNYRKGEE